jgi:hypothetical protein
MPWDGRSGREDGVDIMDNEMLEMLSTLDLKERVLAEIIVWLKAKGLWEQCKNQLTTKISSISSKPSWICKECWSKMTIITDSCYECGRKLWKDEL